MVTQIFDTKQAQPRLALNWSTGIAQPLLSVARAGVSTFIGSNGLVQSAPANTQRVDWSSGLAGLLIEAQRINYCINSENLFAWFRPDVDVIADNIISPDGNQTADRLSDKTTTAIHRLFVPATFSVVSGSPYTISFYAKKGTANFIQLFFATGFAGAAYANFDLNAGALGTVGADATAKIYNAGNGWYRCVITSLATSNTSGAASLSFITSSTSGRAESYTGANNNLYVWGVQTEDGAFETSYIPTTTTSVTRNADNATITGTNFDSFWQGGKGSALVRARPFTVSGVSPVLQFDDATADNIIALRGNTTNPELYIKATTDQAQIDAGTIAANTSYRLAGAWAENSCAASLNSGAPILDGVSTIPVVTQARLGSDGTNYLNGHIEAIEYYDERVLNASLQVVSSYAGYRSIIVPVFRDSIIS